MILGQAERDEKTGGLKGPRFQNPHHPDLVEFARHACDDDPAMLGIAAFAMEEGYEDLPEWHRDSYVAWGNDTPEEFRERYMHKMPATQVLLALEDDCSFWFFPG